MKKHPQTITAFGRNWQRFGVLLWVIFLTYAALSLRLSYLRHTKKDQPFLADAGEYLKYAINLEKYGVFSRDTSSATPRPDAYRSPGYPVFLALIMQVLGKKYFYQHVLIMQALLGALLVPLTYRLARFFLPVWASSLAAVLVCLSPHLVSLGSYILTESLFAFWLLISLLFFFYAHQKDHLGLYVVSGVSFGVAYLITPTVFFVPWLMAGLVFLNNGRSRRRSLICGIVLVLVFSMAGIGYYIRNRIYVAPENRGGRALYNITHGSYPDFIYKDPAYQYYMYYEDPEQPAYGSSVNNFIKIFWGRFKSEPRRYLTWYLYGKPGALWNWSLFQGRDVYVYNVRWSLYTVSSPARMTHVFMMWSHPVILSLAFLGGLLHVRRISRIKRIKNQALYSLLIFVFIGYFTFIFMIFAPWPRYSVPLRPELYIATSWAIYFLVRFVNSREYRKKVIKGNNGE